MADVANKDSHPTSNVEDVDLPGAIESVHTSDTVTMETNIDGDPKNYVPEQPVYEWKEITGEFFDAVKELSLGELVHHKIFGLFEAMSAIEMMDPKMDAGMCCNKNTPTPLTFETAVIENKLKLRDLTRPEIIGVVDGIFSCMVSWLEGHSLAQTLFTCLYLHHPYHIEDRALKAFCCAMHKTTEIIRKFVFYAQVFEEEDFEVRYYEFNLFPDITNAKACYMLKEVEDDMTKKLKNNVDGVADDATATDETQAIISRLRFLRLLLQALIAIWPDKKLSPTEAEMSEIQKFLSAAADLVPNIRKTISIGTQPEAGADEPNPMGFSPMVNQRMLPPTFPRFTKIKDRSQSMAFLEELVQRTKITCKVIHCNNYHSALNFFMDFSKKAGPCLLSRSILQCLYFPTPSNRFGTTSMAEVLRESAKIFIAPPALMPRNPLSTNPLAISCVDAFFKYCVNMYTFVMFIQICGYNKARQRDKLARLLDDFANLEDEAERVDGYLHSLTTGDKEPQPYFSTWVLYHSLRAISMYLLSGFELELYSIHEYIYIYWYLSQFLYNWIVSTLSRAECLSEKGPAAGGGGVGGGGGGVGGTKPKKPKHNKKKHMNIYYREIILNQAVSNMFNGFFKALAGMTKENRIPQPLAMFDNEKVRFDHRFAPFAGITTLPPITYASFSNMRAFMMLETDATHLYSDAGKHFHRARIMLESITNPDSEVMDIIRVAKINFVVTNLLANGHKRDSKLPPIFDFGIHKYFPTIKLQ